MATPLDIYDGDILDVSMMVSPMVSLLERHPWCHYDGVILDVTMMVSPFVTKVTPS